MAIGLKQTLRILSWGSCGLALSLGLSMCTFRQAPISDETVEVEEETGPSTEELAFAESCSAITAPLSPEELGTAQVAWQYFVNNRQPETGLTNAANNFPSATLWDQGNYLTALNAARWLGLVDQPEFDLQLNQFLTSLGELPLFEDALPNKVYNTQTKAMVDYGNQPTEEGLGWSALDLGRMLAALDIVRRCHPEYRPWIEGIVARWELDRSVVDGQLFGGIPREDKSLSKNPVLQVQEGRLGYEEYAARGYSLWGYELPKALSLEPAKSVTVEGVSFLVDSRDFAESEANNYVVSESYILDAIEFGWDDSLAEQAKQVFEAQKQRYKNTGKLTAVSEDNIDKAPHFLYSTVYANGNPWAVITEDNKPHPELRTLSTKAAFGWHYLFPEDEYAQQLMEAVKDLKAEDGGGYYAGRYEADGEVNAILTGNTNGLLLEILYFKARGQAPLLAGVLDNDELTASAIATEKSGEGESAADKTETAQP